jgi:hypothetical protein
MEMEVDSTLL